MSKCSDTWHTTASIGPAKLCPSRGARHLAPGEVIRFEHGDAPTRPLHPDDWKSCHMYNARTGAIETRWRGDLVDEMPLHALDPEDKDGDS